MAGDSTASVELAQALAATVLGEPLVKRALLLDELLRTRNPLALVRAVQLAEILVAHAALTKRASRSSPLLRGASPPGRVG